MPTITFGGLEFGDPCAAQPLELTELEFTFDSNELVDNATYFSRTIRVKATTVKPVLLRADTGLKAFSAMLYPITTTETTQHDGFFTLPSALEGSTTIYLKAGNAQGHEMAFQGMKNISVVPSPIGPDSDKMLRLRKYYRGGLLRRWIGKFVRRLGE